MTVETIKEIREAESLILEGYTKMGAAISSLNSISRQQAATNENLNREVQLVFAGLHTILEDAGFPRDSGPDLQLAERLQRALAHSRPQEAMDKLDELIEKLGVMPTQTGSVNDKVRQLAETLQVKLTFLSSMAEDRLAIIEKCHKILDEANIPEAGPKGQFWLLEHRIKALIDLARTKRG